jgi:hypothetical protein
MTASQFTVTGTWPFPVDMLRYDDARPATVSDADLIEVLTQENASDAVWSADGRFKRFEITLVGERLNFRPTTARWESFGWSVPSDRYFYETMAESRQERDRERLVSSALSKLTPQERAAVERKFNRP